MSNAGKSIISSAHLIKPEDSGHGQRFVTFATSRKGFNSFFLSQSLGHSLGSKFGGLTKSITSLSSGSLGSITSLSSGSAGSIGSLSSSSSSSSSSHGHSVNHGEGELSYCQRFILMNKIPFKRTLPPTDQATATIFQSRTAIKAMMPNP